MTLDRDGEVLVVKTAWVTRRVTCTKSLLRLCERIRRTDEGRPLLELVKDRNWPGPA